MAVNFEIKGMLAKLLATEDIIVEHKNVDTACFNVDTRVLTLPLWKAASDNIYTMLVLHEISHSLWTPNIDWTDDYKISCQFVNIVEDVRVEKLCKRKYPGSPKSLYFGYKELHEQDFFKVSGENIEEFNLADRVNLHFKIGNFIDVKFNDEEMKIVQMISDCESFEDTLHAAKVLYDYCKENENMKGDLEDLSDSQQSFSGNAENNESGEDSSDKNESEDIGPSSQESEDSDSQQKDNFNTESDLNDTKNTNNSTQTQQNSTSTTHKEPEVRTMNSFEEGVRELAIKSGFDNVYVEIPKVNLNTIIGNNKEVHDDLNMWFKAENSKGFDAFQYSDQELKTFKNSIQKEVNYLVKEFECLKAADAHSRSSVSRTGVLDTSRLHSYRFSEDIFKKITIVPDGKNHGLIFVLDWSGSMQHVILDTCKQLLILVWFCKKVSIPFDVYIFTNEWRRVKYDVTREQYVPADITPHYEKKSGFIPVDESFSLVNILTSKVSSKEMESQILNVWRLVYYFNGGSSHYSLPRRYGLSGTPLNEALIALHEVIPQFQKENKLQKVHCIILTDGEAGALPYTVDIEKTIPYSGKRETYVGYRSINFDNSFLRDKKTGCIYKIFPNQRGYHEFTDTLLRNLRDKFSSVNFIGIRIISGRDMHRFVNLYHTYYDTQYKTIQNDWKKVKSFTITNSGYHAYFGLSSSSLSQDTSFEVNDRATKSQIKNAFEKSLGNKKSNKKILKEFISLIV